MPHYDVDWFHDTAFETQVRWLAVDPQTPFARTTQASLAVDELAALLAFAATWLRLG